MKFMRYSQRTKNSFCRIKLKKSKISPGFLSEPENARDKTYVKKPDEFFWIDIIVVQNNKDVIKEWAKQINKEYCYYYTVWMITGLSFIINVIGFSILGSVNQIVNATLFNKNFASLFNATEKKWLELLVTQI